MEPYEDSFMQNLDLIHVFQQKVNEICYDLLAAKDNEFLTIAWVRKLLDGFTSCQDGFQFMVVKNISQFSAPPTDRLVSELFDRSVKALDIFNETRDGIEKVRHWLENLEIVLCALNPHQRMMCEGQLRRAKKVMDSAMLAIGEKKTKTAGVFSRKYQSFGGNVKRNDAYYHPPGNLRSVSLGMSRSWSATKQLELIANKLKSPCRNEIADSHGLAIPIYTMNFIMLFVLWVLVAVTPGQDQSIDTHFEFPRQISSYPWSTPLYLLHGRIIVESSKHQKQNCSGLLKEICQIKRCVQCTTDLVESIKFPLTEDLDEEVRESVNELSPLFEVAKTELDPLQRHVKKVFRKIISSRSEVLEILGKATEP